jgi:hypothetical protein
MTHAPDETGNSGDQSNEGERPDAGDPGSFANEPEIEAALDPDQEAAGDRRTDRERLAIEIAVQRNRSACQRTWSAMKVEMK